MTLSALVAWKKDTLSGWMFRLGILPACLTTRDMLIAEKFPPCLHFHTTLARWAALASLLASFAIGGTPSGLLLLAVCFLCFA